MVLKNIDNTSITFKDQQKQMNEANQAYKRLHQEIISTKDKIRQETREDRDKATKTMKDELVKISNLTMDDFETNLITSVNKIVEDATAKTQQDLTSYIQQEKEDISRLFDKLQSDSNTTPKHQNRDDDPKSSTHHLTSSKLHTIFTPKVNDIPSVSSPEDNMDVEAQTIKYVLNLSGCYNKMIDDVIQPGLYRLWNKTYARIDNNIPTEGVQQARFNGSFRYSFNGELYSLDAKG